VIKKNFGFSYIEVTIALAVFSIVVMAVLPILGQAGRNLSFARRGYQSHLAAQSMMLAVRDALPDVGAARVVAGQYAARLGVDDYGVWIFHECPLTKDVFFDASENTEPVPPIGVSLDGLAEFSLEGNTTIIVVVIWDNYQNIAGRAIGAVLPRK